MGEARRRSLLGLPPRGEKFEEGVSSIFDGQVPLECGECHAEVVPEAMIFFGRCRCGPAVGSCHAAKSEVQSSGVFVGFLVSLIDKLLGRGGPDVH
jgi:hypothetical protein